MTHGNIKERRFQGTNGIIGLLIVWASALVMAPASEKKESVEPTTLALSENLIITAESVAPEMDGKSGDLIGLAATGQVKIRVRPDGTEKWIEVTCGKLVYDVDRDEIVLRQKPVVRSGIQVLRATSPDTFVKVSRKSGKWMIKGPHKIELKLK